VFVRAKAGQFDAVLTMFHDQGQIAMKLLGFDRGVTLLGGYPFPICTPAHGTAYDIAGQGRRERRRGARGGALAAKMAGPALWPRCAGGRRRRPDSLHPGGSRAKFVRGISETSTQGVL
jgi:4-hydroxythreonine-4-phosphate dehydrogenase